MRKKKTKNPIVHNVLVLKMTNASPIVFLFTEISLAKGLYIFFMSLLYLRDPVFKNQGGAALMT